MGGVSSAPKPKPQGRTLAIDVFQRLRNDVVFCLLKPEERLRFDRLRWRYGVSVGTLREALVQLTAEGLIQMEGQRGFRVAPVSAVDLSEVIGLRGTLDPMALRALIARGPNHGSSAVAHGLQAFREARARRAGGERDGARAEAAAAEALFLALVSGGESPWLTYFCAMLYRQTARYWTLTRPLHGREEAAPPGLDEVAEAALSGEAERAMLRHQAGLRAAEAAILPCLSAARSGDRDGAG